MMLVKESEEHKMWRKHSKTPVVYIILFLVEIKPSRGNRVNKRGKEIVQAEVSLTFFNRMTLSSHKVFLDSGVTTPL